LRKLLHEINELVERFSWCSNIHFTVIYILEAHATDEWPLYALPMEYETTQHRSMEERIMRANLLPELFSLHPNIKIFVDNEHDIFTDVLCSWPFRYWIIRNDIIVNKMMPEGYEITIDSLTEWLNEWSSSFDLPQMEKTTFL
jgi:hypothetical protein